MKFNFIRKIMVQAPKSGVPATYCYCLLPLLLPLALPAQNGITISNFSTKAGPPATLMFNVQWTPPAGKAWSDTVWVFADYNNKGTMTRLPLAKGATLTNPSWGGAKVLEVSGNDKGVWVVGNARTKGSFSATVQLRTGGSARYPLRGLCLYAVNYPPVGKYTAADKVIFTGTPPFVITFADKRVVTLPRKTPPYVYAQTFTPTNIPSSFTDASGAPGVFICKTPVTQTLVASAAAYCAGSGVTLALRGTEKGVAYQLYKNNAPAGQPLTGNGSAMTFTDGGKRSFGKGTYTVQIVSGAYCNAVMNKLAIAEQAMPAIPEITTLSATTVCQNNDLEFRVTMPVKGATYTWSGNPSGAAHGPGNFRYMVRRAPAGVSSVSVYSHVTASGVTCRSANAATVTAWVQALPATPTLSTTPVCEGSRNIYFRVISSVPRATYTWSGAAGHPLNTGSDVFVAEGATIGTKSVSAYSEVPAGGVVCRSAPSPAIPAVIIPIPAVPVLTRGNSSGTVCASDVTDVIFKATGTPGSVFQWFGRGTTSGINNDTYTERAYFQGQYWTSARASLTLGGTICWSSKSKYIITYAVECTPTGSILDFDEFDPDPYAATGISWTLKDTRAGGNNNQYKVKKMPDGKIWMIQDLKFGTCPNSTARWYDEGSEEATQHEPTIYTGYVGHCRASKQQGAGYLYSWPAAMNNARAYHNSHVVVGCSGQKICRGACD